MSLCSIWGHICHLAPVWNLWPLPSVLLTTRLRPYVRSSCPALGAVMLSRHALPYEPKMSLLAAAEPISELLLYLLYSKKGCTVIKSAFTLPIFIPLGNFKLCRIFREVLWLLLLEKERPKVLPEDRKFSLLVYVRLFPSLWFSLAVPLYCNLSPWYWYATPPLYTDVMPVGCFSGVQSPLSPGLRSSLRLLALAKNVRPDLGVKRSPNNRPRKRWSVPTPASTLPMSPMLYSFFSCTFIASFFASLSPIFWAKKSSLSKTLIFFTI